MFCVGLVRVDLRDIKLDSVKLNASLDVDIVFAAERRTNRIIRCVMYDELSVQDSIGQL